MERKKTQKEWLESLPAPVDHHKAIEIEKKWNRMKMVKKIRSANG